MPDFAPDARVIAVGMPHVAREIAVMSRGYTVKRDFVLVLMQNMNFTEMRFYDF